MTDKAHAASKKAPRRALGRGLDSLFVKPAVPSAAAVPPAESAPASVDPALAGRRRDMFRCAIERIVPRRDQPRQQLDTTALEELAATIAERGVISPLLVRRIGEDRYEIIAGERRWRAAQHAGLKDVPVMVQDLSTEDAFEVALIENLQRQDLNAIEVAEAYLRLRDEHGYTQEQLGEKVGKSRVAVTNALRLLKLPADVRELVSSGALSEGHARALLGVPDEESMRALAHKVSVRKLEQLVRSRAKQTTRNKDDGPGAATNKSANVRDLEERLSRALGTKTTIDHRGTGGAITIAYGSLDELDRLLDKLLG